MTWWPLFAALLSVTPSFTVAQDTVSFDLSTYGAESESPYQSYLSNTELKPPELLITKNKTGLAPGLVFVGVDGKPSSTQNVPCIFDFSEENFGTLIWAGVNYTEPFDFRTQTYKGESVLTFWSGKLLDGYGHGSYYILNQSYAEIAHFSPVGYPDLGDLHEFIITPNDTAIVIIYAVVPMDLTPVGGPVDGWIFEGMFQEVDIETNQVLFTWNASKHVGLNESYNQLAETGNPAKPFDWFHINSIEKDPAGDYLVSARVMNCIYKVSGKDGSIIWRMQGKQSDFQVDPAASFTFQHDARWTDGVTQNQMTIFDNGIQGSSPYSRGLLLSVDQSAKTVSLVTEFTNDAKTFAKYEGNLQRINASDPQSNFFLGFGSQSYFTELNSDGEILLDVQFARTNVVNSYRAYKLPWTGKPLTRPDIYYDKQGAKAHLSWNGATEVFQWIIYTADDLNATTWYPLHTALRAGFETTIDLLPNNTRVDAFVRGRAVDGSMEHLGWTAATDGGNFYPVADVPEQQQTATSTTVASGTVPTGAAAAAGWRADKKGTAAMVSGRSGWWVGLVGLAVWEVVGLWW